MQEIQSGDAQNDPQFTNDDEHSQASGNDSVTEDATTSTSLRSQWESSSSARVDFTPLRSAVDAIRKQIGTVIVGQHEMVDLLIAALFCDGHVLIEGVPGVAKTLTARLLAQCLSVDFSRIQFTPDLMPSDVLGTMVFNPKTIEFDFKRGPVFSNVVLIDEINRSPAKTQSALFEVMEEHQVTIDGVTHPMSQPFFVVATQNPIDHEGTYRLPEAQLDRFLFRVDVSYPTTAEELMVLEQAHERRHDRNQMAVTAVLSANDISKARLLVRSIHVDPLIMEYVVAIISKTRNNPSIFLGGSPRASLGILLAAKAFAGMAGRDFVIPDDVLSVAVPVLAHRIQLTAEREMEGKSPHIVLRELLQTVEVPR